MKDERLPYLHFLDGFRAIAIVMAIAWHARGPATTHYMQLFEAWLGVDAFFVVSGFLVTAALVQERLDTGSFGLRAFYARRALRFLPAYAVFLIGMLLFYGRHALRPVAIAAAFLGNYDRALDWGFYTSFPGGLHAVGPTWAICVAVQFYLLWPAALSWFGQRDDADPAGVPRALKVTLAALAAMVVWKTALLIHDPSLDNDRIWFSFETRAGGLLVGSSAALAWQSPRLRERIRAGLEGPWTPGVLVVMLALAVQTVRTQEQHALFTRVMAWSVSLPTFSVLVALLILALLVHPSSGIARVLSRPALGWLGRLSYGIYLWHTFALLESQQLDGAIGRALPFARQGTVELVTDAVGVVLALALGCLSYYVIERPFLRLKDRFHTTAPVSARAVT